MQGDHPQNDGSYLRCIQFAYDITFGNVIALTHPGGAPRFRVRDANGEWTTDPELVRPRVSHLCKSYMQGLRVVGHYFTADMEWFCHYGLDLRDEYDAAPKPSKIQLRRRSNRASCTRVGRDTVVRSGRSTGHALDVPALLDRASQPKKQAKLDAATQFKAELKPYREALSDWRKARTAFLKFIATASDKKPEAKQKKNDELLALLKAAKRRLDKLDAERALIELKHEERLAELENGYGWIPDDVLYLYGAFDVAAELDLGRTYLEYLKEDRYGNNCSKQYWIAHRAALAALEINCAGSAG